MRPLEMVMPTPSPTPAFDPNVITPGPVGFAAIFLVAVATVLIILDMTRRVRRVRYRSEVRDEIARELAERSEPQTPPGDNADGSEPGLSAPTPGEHDQPDDPEDDKRQADDQHRE